jgi:dihydrofolate reductase
MYIIAAHDQNKIIGYNNTIPWKLTEDLKHFRELTLNNIVIMGRKTFQSISKPLNNRINIVITREPKKIKETIYYFKEVIYSTLENLDNILTSLYEKEENKNKKTFVIGGSEIYNALIHKCNKMYITEIDRPYNNSTFLEPDKYSYFHYNIEDWFSVYKSKDFISKDNSDIGYNYITYIRKNETKNETNNETNNEIN